MKRTFLLVLLLAAAGVLAAACGSDAGGATGSYVAKVDDDELSLDELEERNEADAAPGPDGETVAPPLLLTLSDWIVETLVTNTLEAEGITLTEGDLANGAAITAPGAADEEVRRAAGQARVAYEFSDVDPPTAEEVQAQADANPPVESTCTSHILLETEEDALAAVERLDAGEDFAELAAEISTGPSGPVGGDLGCGPPGQYVAEFETAMNAAEVGVPTAPVQSQFGWHVILVTERTLADVEGEAALIAARAAVINTQLETLRAGYLDFLVESEDRVDVDPRYGEWVAEEGVVVPPEGSDPQGVDATTTTLGLPPVPDTLPEG